MIIRFNVETLKNFQFPLQGVIGGEKMGKHLLSHRYNLLPLLRSHPGGVRRELVVKDLPATKVAKLLRLQNTVL
ncbi:hypothetical protein ACVWYG_001947 [Pedobacter sp. UYEF25]